MRVKSGDIRFNTNFEVDTGGGGLGIIDSLGTSLDVRAHTVIVAGGECRSVTQALNGDSVIRSAEADSTGVAGELAVGDVVRGLGTDQEPITAKDGVGGERWSLKRRTSEHPEIHVRKIQVPNLEDVEESAGVKTGLLVDGSQQGGLGTLVWQQGGSEVEFQTFSDLVLELNLTAKHVRGRPGLGEGETVVLEAVFRLEVTGDSSLGIPKESDLEGHGGRRGGLDFERGSVNGVILAKEVVGGLPEVLQPKKRVKNETGVNFRDGIPSRRVELVEGEPFGFRSQ